VPVAVAVVGVVVGVAVVVVGWQCVERVGRVIAGILSGEKFEIGCGVAVDGGGWQWIGNFKGIMRKLKIGVAVAVVVGEGVAVVAWQCVERVGWVMGIILIGGKFEIGSGVSGNGSKLGIGAIESIRECVLFIDESCIKTNHNQKHSEFTLATTQNDRNDTPHSMLPPPLPPSHCQCHHSHSHCQKCSDSQLVTYQNDRTATLDPMLPPPLPPSHSQSHCSHSHPHRHPPSASNASAHTPRSWNPCSTDSGRIVPVSQITTSGLRPTWPVATATDTDTGSGSGCMAVAVAALDGPWQCEHFDRRQVGNQMHIGCGSGSVAVAVKKKKKTGSCKKKKKF
jgi:hypothetical protein